MLLAVVGVSTVEREVDAPDEGDAIVDHDRLLVMAVHEPDAGVELAVDPVSKIEPLDHPPNLSAGRTEDRYRSATPDEHAHVDPLGQLGEQVSHDRGLVASRELELRGEEAAGEMDVGLRSCQLVCDHGQERRSVDEDLDGVSRPYGQLASGPVGAVGLERAVPADLAQPPGVMRSNRAIDGAAESVTRCHADISSDAVRRAGRLGDGGPGAQRPRACRRSRSSLSNPTNDEPKCDSENGSS